MYKGMVVMNSKTNKRKIYIIGSCLIFFISLSLIILIGRSFAAPLDNDVEVEPNTELTYYLNVSYDGVDREGVVSSDTTTAEIKSGYLYVEDKLPDGLTFDSFITTSDGSIGAVRRSDGTVCPGKVIDDTNEASTTTGTWNAAKTEYTYHGLHYNTATRKVTFTVKNLQAGCILTVGIKTITPTLDDPTTTEVETRRDFYNFATAREKNLTINSNTVHAFMGRENATLYNVTYSYTGTVPSNAPTLPSSASYAPSATVGVASSATLEGYTFSGWTTTDATVNNNSFKMPTKNVNFTGSFTKISTYKVTYKLTGTTPSGYVLPSTKSYYKGANVSLDSLKAGDIFNGYRFLGWTTTDVSINSDGDFIMPGKAVTITGQFEEVTYTLSYKFYDTVLPPNSSAYLPASKTYKPGDKVTLATISTEPSGYKFLGWYKETTFEMPEEDVVVYGEWKVQTGTFAPTITKEIINQKDSYYVGEVVKFKITVTNTATFAIRDIIVKENLEETKFISGTGYTVLSDHIATITTLSANSSQILYANYTVPATAKGNIINTVTLKGALADNNYELADKTYEASANFNVVGITLNLRLTDKDNNELSEGTFALYNDENLTTKISDAMTYKDLTPGNTYYLKQTRVQAGYVILKDIYAVDVNINGNITIKDTNYTPVDGVVTVTLQNEKTKDLPNTGGIGITPYLIIGLLGIIASSIGYIIYLKKSKTL